jgi:hypothetical protein
MKSHPRLGFFFALACALAFLAIVSSSTQAALIASETFDGYTHFPDTPSDPRNNGVPLVLPANTEGADSPLWMGVRVGSTQQGSIAQDIGVQKFGSIAYLSAVGRTADDAGLVMRLDLTNYTNVNLSFDWRMHATEQHDFFKVAYYQGDGTAFQPEGLGTPNNIYDWFNDPQLGAGSMTWYQTFWLPNELLNAPGNGTNNSTTMKVFPPTPLPGGDILYLLFWLDNGSASTGDSDLGKFDNVLITGDLIVPEPGSLVLLGLSVAGLTLLRCRRSC